MGRRGARKGAVNLSTLRTIGFALVLIGFFMPVTRVHSSGFRLIETLMGGRAFGAGENILMGLLTIAVFATAIVGLVIGVLILMNRKTNIPATTGWIVLLVCIGSGLIVFFAGLNSPSLQNGGILILIGWVVALVGQVLARAK